MARLTIIALLASIASAQVAAQGTSEADVREFLARLDRALAAKNAAEVGKLISENAQISGTVNAGGRITTFKYGKAQYVAALRDTWARASNYLYRRTNQEIVVSGGKATVTADVSESAIMQGRYVASKAREVWTLERINGVLLLTGMVARGTIRGAQ